MKVILKSNIHLAISVGESVYIALVYLDSKDFLNTTKPSSCVILRYKSITYIVHRIASTVKRRRLVNFLRKSILSLIHDLTFVSKV